MAYDPKNLSVLAYANGFTLWHYWTTGLRSTVRAHGYFEQARDMLRAGDCVKVVQHMAMLSQGKPRLIPLEMYDVMIINDGPEFDGQLCTRETR